MFCQSSGDGVVDVAEKPDFALIEEGSSWQKKDLHVSLSDCWPSSACLLFLGYDRVSDQAARTAQAASCPSGWLCLYDGLDGTGRRLQFRDEYWNNLMPHKSASPTRPSGLPVRR